VITTFIAVPLRAKRPPHAPALGFSIKAARRSLVEGRDDVVLLRVARIAALVAGGTTALSVLLNFANSIGCSFGTSSCSAGCGDSLDP
jgi:hypothetical protein